MSIFAKSLILFVSCLLGGCVTSTLVVGEPGDAVAEEEVVVYFIDRPTCNFETIAHIQASGGYTSLQSLLQKMRSEAAELGASGIYLLHTEQSAMREFGGTAKAIRCRPV